jgi:hypothetical protein
LITRERLPCNKGKDEGWKLLLLEERGNSAQENFSNKAKLNPEHSRRQEWCAHHSRTPALLGRRRYADLGSGKQVTLSAISVDAYNNFWGVSLVCVL